MNFQIFNCSRIFDARDVCGTNGKRGNRKPGGLVRVPSCARKFDSGFEIYTMHVRAAFVDLGADSDSENGGARIPTLLLGRAALPRYSKLDLQGGCKPAGLLYQSGRYQDAPIQSRI